MWAITQLIIFALFACYFLIRPYSGKTQKPACRHGPVSLFKISVLMPRFFLLRVISPGDSYTGSYLYPHVFDSKLLLSMQRKHSSDTWTVHSSLFLARREAGEVICFHVRWDPFTAAKLEQLEAHRQNVEQRAVDFVWGFQETCVFFPVSWRKWKHPNKTHQLEAHISTMLSYY